MTYCNVVHESDFEYVLKEASDFNSRYPTELDVEYLLIMDPVGYNFFMKTNTNGLLKAVKQVHPTRMDRRDVLQAMEIIWRVNNQGNRVLNEQKYTTPEAVEIRVRQLMEIAYKQLIQQAKIENEVTSDVILAHFYERPLSHPVHTSGKLSSSTRIVHPAIQHGQTPQPFFPHKKTHANPRTGRAVQRWSHKIF